MSLRAQTTASSPTAKVEFEVASVKPNKSGDNRNRSIRTAPGGRFEVINMTLRTLVRLAYPVQNDQIAGGPAWLDSDMFDLSARIDPSLLAASGMLPKDRLQQMMRALLSDRFKFAAHPESP